MAEPFQIHVPSIIMRLAPDETAEASNQLLYGEIVYVLEQSGEWVNVQAEHDNYEGFIPMSVLGAPHETPYKINVPLTHIYEDADFKAPVFALLYLGSHLATTDVTQNGFRQLAHEGWVFEGHLADSKFVQGDYVEVSLQFEGAPYMWGGRTVSGIDCSGLVQVSLIAAGIDCPRDTKDQVKNIGQNIKGERALQRGDLVFFKGHVGIMLDEENILNATARHMRAVIEPLKDVESAYNGIVAVRRL